jgi:uncharacterized phage protein gp47/JayE
MFNRDSLPTIVARTREDMLSRLSQDELLRRADAEISARVLAGLSHEFLGYLDWISKQVLYDSSDEDVLVRQASTFKVFQKPAEFASGVLPATGVNGRVIEVDKILRRRDGVEYITTAEVVIAGGTANVPVKAVLAGAAGNAATGTILTLVNPIDGVQSQLTVGATEIANGSDTEQVPPFRARFLRRLAAPPSGGSLLDYETWALEVPGVTRAWATAGEMGAGTVTVRFMRDNDLSPIPDAAEVQVVYDYIQSKRPATAILYVVAPVAMPQFFEIELTPGSLAVKAAVEAELRDLLQREAKPAGTILLSHLDEATSVAAGEEDHVLVSPTANLLFGVGQMATYGGVTWL